MARPIGLAVQRARREHRQQRIQLLEPLFAKLPAPALLELAERGDFPADDQNDEKDRPNGSVVQL